MNEENEIEEKPQVNFYKLDKTKPYKSVYAGTSSYSMSTITIIFSVVFLTADAVITIVNFIQNSNMFNDVMAIIVPILLAALGLFFLSMGIWYRSREKKLKGAERKIFNDCTLTDGRIVEYICIERQTNSIKHGTRTTY